MVSDAQTIPETIQRATPPVPAADALVLAPIEQVDVLTLEPPAELLRKIAGLAKTIDALLEAGMTEQARPLSRELIALANAAQSS